MAISTSGLASYLHLPTDNTESLTPYLAAAKSMARDAGVPVFSNNAQYDLFIYSLAAMFYDNRGMAFSGSYQATAEKNARAMINSFVLQLRDASEDPADAEAEVEVEGGDPA